MGPGHSRQRAPSLSAPRSCAKNRGSHGEDPARRRQRDEPRHAFPPPRAPRLRGRHRGRRPAGSGPRAVGGPRPHPHGHEPARDRRLGGHAPAEGDGPHEGRAHHRAHRARDVRGPREGPGRRLQRLRHQAHRAAPPAGQDRGAAGFQAAGMSGGGGPAPGADRARGALLAHMRHELRTPVNAILGYSEMLIEDQASGGALDDLRKIESAGRNLLGLINEILDPARLGREGDLEAAGARIRHDLRTPVNAIIGYSEMLIEDAEEAGSAGITADLRRIHGAGHRLLALIDDIVRLSEGAEKDEDEGVASMVRQTVSSIRSLDAAALAPDSGGGRILVVDDNEINRDMLSRRLERQGYAPVQADNGRRALEMLRAESFDLVLLDILMPDINGYQVLEQMKSDSELRHIPVIMISALDEIDSVVRCIEAGAEDYLSKPFNPVLLKARLGASLEKKRLRDREVVYL